MSLYQILSYESLSYHYEELQSAFIRWLERLVLYQAGAL